MKIIELGQDRLERLFCNWTRCHPVNADLHDLQAGIFEFREKLTSEEKTVSGQAGGKAQFAAVANKFDNIRMHKRLAADQSDPHRAKLTNFPYPFFQIVEARMRPAVVVLGAIGTIEITAIGHVKTALQRFAVDEALARFQNVIARKFAADFVEKLHAMTKEHAAYDNLPAKQSRWEISLHNASDLLGESQRPPGNPPAINRAPASPSATANTHTKNDRILTSWPNLAHPINHAFGSVRHRLVPFRQKFGQNRKVLHWMPRGFRIGLNVDNVGRRMPGKVLLEVGPGAGQDPAASIETRDRSAEDVTRERKRCDVARGRASVSV